MNSGEFTMLVIKNRVFAHRIKQCRTILLEILTLIFFPGCHSQPLSHEIPLADLNQEMQSSVSDAGFYPVYTWYPATPSGHRLRIYIEGDGRGWLRSGRASYDPTPLNRLVHHLMMHDLSPDIAYVSQPCQYKMGAACNRNVWTFGRYSQKVVDSMNAVVSDIKAKGGYKTLELVGYSGGGTVALLMAATRDDVISVRTIAGNLAPHFTNQLHTASAMPLALNPSDFRAKLMSVPQIHFVGTNDSVIPETVSRHYANTIADTSCVTISSIEADHQKGWINYWPQLLAVEPRCKR
ncbi:alpha/beta fold hydrolase [Endozoicomonas sp. SCSIO W0465]|uniref:alpha/beta fold hydrolase n=1 Tax=Endozoicomonas sp. SCSIO W0465 TaxID=2918516 RepID=UPI002075E0F5|nr:hypothetical protein [Endozoicomonas sp. SCSIO W0465]USE33796.1 hypothetical protein MJO57_16585 [Endozoicomonas sp. SCSIO W0465]